MARHLALVILMAVSTAAVGCKKGKGSAGAAEPKTEDQKTLYALGLMLGRNIAVFNLNKEEIEQVKAGMTDQVLRNKPVVALEAYGPKVDSMARARQSAAAEVEKGRAKTILEAAAKESGAVKTASGLVIRTTKPGVGATPTATDKVKVHYVGTLPDGTEFDSSIKRNEPAVFPVTGVIGCWTEALQRMKVGEKAKLTCPAEIAYGDSGHPPSIPGGATLLFDVELLDIVK
jgi:FKBP-type peptidyl-prolyl cis-trans isomerase FkpA